MALPLTRNTTYAVKSPVKSADLNAIQDQIVANHDRLWLNWTRFNIKSDNDGVVDTVTPFAGLAVGARAGLTTAVFVASTSQKIYWSYDAQHWFEAATYSADWAFANGTEHAGKTIIHCARLGLFIACGANSAASILTSPTGDVWTARADPGPVANLLQRGPIVDNGAILVTCHPGAAGGFLTSTDAITWTLRTNPAADKVIRDIAWSPSLGRFCAINASGNRITSSDGITWTDQGNLLGGSPNVITWSAHHNVFVANGPNVTQRSVDGITWTAVTDLGHPLKSLISDGPAIYGLGGYLLRSADGGLTWQAANSLPYSDSWHGIAKADGGRLVAFGGFFPGGGSVCHQLVAMTSKLTA